VIRNRFLVLFIGLALTGMLSCTAGDLALAPQLGGEPSTVDGGLPPADSTVVPVDTPTTTPIEPPVDTVTPPPVDTVPSVPEDTPLEPQNPWAPGTSVLVCELQPYASATAEIGRAGGQITVGNHSLKIPERALSKPVVITMEQVEGTANSVRFSPEGLQFERPAVLTLSYKGCPIIRHWKRIVYTDEQLNILEPTLSYDFSSSRQVKGLIYHFSRYAVAY
jgi:hypothetical protein